MKVLRLTPDAVKAVLDSMESNDHCTINYHQQISEVREQIAEFVGDGGLVLMLPAESLMDDLPPRVRPLAAAVGIADRPVDLWERAREWITDFFADADESRTNRVALMLGAADDAIRCAVNHKAGDEQEQG